MWEFQALEYGIPRAHDRLSLQEDCMTDNQTLTITDNRTQQSYTIPIYRGTVRAMDLRQIKTNPDDFGLMTYDPAFMNTASCQSAVTDRKSTRLNSSHANISYAVFCLKKKKKTSMTTHTKKVNYNLHTHHTAVSLS